MSEIILFLVIVALGVLIGWQEYQGRKEREKLMKMIMSRNAQDLANLELAEKVSEINPNPSLINEDDFTAESELGEKEFDKYSLGKEEDGR